MYSKIGASITQRLVKFLNKQAFAADLIERPVENSIAGRFHRYKLQLRAGLGFGDGTHHHAALNDRERAVSAADSDLHSSSSNTRRISFAARAVLWWSFPVDTTPAIRSSPAQIAGK